MKDNEDKKKKQRAELIAQVLGLGVVTLMYCGMHMYYRRGVKRGMKVGIARGKLEGYLQATSDVTDAYLADPDELRCFFDKHIEDCKLTDDEIRNAIQNGHHLLETWFTVKN